MPMVRPIALAILAALAVAGCTSARESSSSREPVGAIEGVSGGFVRSSDTYGTGRRVDVFGPQNAPVLPTIGTPGYGK